MQHDQLICLENGPLPEAEGAGGIGHPFTHGLKTSLNKTSLDDTGASQDDTGVTE